MNKQKELQIIKVEDIMINPENPRHNEVQLTIPEMGEELIMKQLTLSELDVRTILLPEPNIKKEDIIIFSNINIDNLDFNNERANGIKSLAYEIQHSSRKNGYKYYPISYCFLLRALLEQTSIYFLINANKWKKLISGKNRDLNLGEIIKYITNNADNLFFDEI